MNILRHIILMCAAIGISLHAQSQEKLRLAVLDPVIAGEKLTDGLQISVREIVSSSFVNNADNYSIVERSLLDKVMQEAKFSNSDAVDESQATQLGKLAGADKVVLTVISRFESRCMISIKLINVETATIDRQISKMVEYNSVLDVTEPLTLAILGKGDGSVKASSPASQPRPAANARPSASPVNANIATSYQIPEYKGTGVTFQSTGWDIAAQPEEFDLTNMERIADNKYYNVVFDFSEAMVMGMNILNFAESKRPANERVFGYDFINRFSSETNRFVEQLNKSKEQQFSYNPQAPITLVVKVREIDEPGRVNTSDYVFVDTQTGESLAGIRLISKGGRFGSFQNLMGDAFEEGAAPKFMKQLKSSIKKSKKKKQYFIK